MFIMWSQILSRHKTRWQYQTELICYEGLDEIRQELIFLLFTISRTCCILSQSNVVLGGLNICVNGLCSVIIWLEETINDNVVLCNNV